MFQSSALKNFAKSGRKQIEMSTSPGNHQHQHGELKVYVHQLTVQKITSDIRKLFEQEVKSDSDELVGCSLHFAQVNLNVI